MKTILFGTLLLIIFWTSIGKAQPNDFQNPAKEATLSGTNVEGVRLLIKLTNNVIAVGSTVNLSVQIKNTSTNLIAVGVGDPSTDFEVYLINETGNVYKISREPSNNNYALIPQIFINAGESYKWIVPITIGKQIATGHYALKVKKQFAKNGNLFEIISDILEVQIN